MKGDSACFRACNLALEGASMQGFTESQRKLDEAISLCPTMDYAFEQKSVPFLKRGDFITWKLLMDKAVELNPQQLGYRGWCRFQFVRDYKGAIEDIEKLSEINQGFVGYSINGDYHLNVAKALCYKKLGEQQKAISIIETQLTQKDYSPMPYDYLHLGVLNIETGNFAKAIEYFQKSIQLNDYLAEVYYYLGIAYKKQGNLLSSRENLDKAKVFYLKGYRRSDPYTHPIDKIYLSQIEEALSGK